MTGLLAEIQEALQEITHDGKAENWLDPRFKSHFDHLFRGTDLFRYEADLPSGYVMSSSIARNGSAVCLKLLYASGYEHVQLDPGTRRYEYTDGQPILFLKFIPGDVEEIRGRFAASSSRTEHIFNIDETYFARDRINLYNLTTGVMAQAKRMSSRLDSYENIQRRITMHRLTDVHWWSDAAWARKALEAAVRALISENDTDVATVLGLIDKTSTLYDR